MERSEILTTMSALKLYGMKSAYGVIKFIAPTVGGAKAADGTILSAHHKIDGGPSVLFDAVAVLLAKRASFHYSSSRRRGTLFPMPTPTTNSSGFQMQPPSCS